MKRRVLAVIVSLMVMSAMTACAYAVPAEPATETKATTVETVEEAATEEVTEAVTEETTEAAVEEATESVTEDAAETTEAKQEAIDDGVYEFDVPQTAVNAAYRYTNDGIAELTYMNDGMNWTYRIKNTDALTDISGLDVEWDLVEDCTIKGNEAKLYGYSESKEEGVIAPGLMIQLVNWYDAEAGTTHSLAVSGMDLNGFDLQAYAEGLSDGSADVELEIPDTAENVLYSVSADGVTELTYILNGNNWSYRTKSTDAFEDISGKNYKWNEEQEISIKGNDGVLYTYCADYDDEGAEGFLTDFFAVQAINWYDASTGLTHAVSVSGMQTSGIDLLGFVANM